MPSRFLRASCQKTQLCSFHELGRCSKGRKCGYAHQASELRAPPDFRYTKLCPSGEACSVPNCRFAHSQDELRRTERRSARKEPELPALPVGLVALPVSKQQSSSSSRETDIDSASTSCFSSEGSWEDEEDAVSRLTRSWGEMMAQRQAEPMRLRVRGTFLEVEQDDVGARRRASSTPGRVALPPAPAPRASACRALYATN